MMSYLQPEVKVDVKSVSLGLLPFSLFQYFRQVPCELFHAQNFGRIVECSMTS